MAWSWQLNFKHDPLYHIHWSPSFSLRSNQYCRYWYYSSSMPLNRLRKKKKTIAKTQQQTIEWRRTMYVIHRTFVASSEEENGSGHTFAKFDYVVGMMIRKRKGIEANRTWFENIIVKVGRKASKSIQNILTQLQFHRQPIRRRGRWSDLELTYHKQLKRRVRRKIHWIGTLLQSIQHPTMRCRKLFIESYQDRNLDQSKNFIVSSSKRAKRNWGT